MKTLRFMIAGACALLALGACKKEEVPEENNNDNGNTPSETVYDDAYYASNATIGSSSLQFTVTDEGGTITFKAEGGTVLVEVDCGTDWTVDNDSEDLFGAEVNVGAGTLVVTADQNYVEEDLGGTLTLKTASEGVSFAVITIVQEAYGSPEISVGAEEWHAPAKGELYTEIAVESSLEDWDATVTVDWLTVEKTGDGLSIEASENTVAEERTADVALSCTDGYRTADAVIRVTQDGAAYVTLGSEELQFSASESYSEVSVESNFEWTAAADDSADWITLNSRDGVLTVSVTENDGDGAREALVTVTASDGAENTAAAYLKVYQELASDPLIFVYTITDDNTEIQLLIYGDVDCTVDWGDGSSEKVTDVQPKHTFEKAGEYEVSVSGTVTAIYSYNLHNSAAKTEKYLTAVKQWGNTGLTSMSMAFRYCTALKTLPETTGNSFKDVTAVDYIFSYCLALEAVPEDLFAKSPYLADFNHAFDYTVITSIPENLFAGNLLATTFYQTFYNCKQLESIPAGLFKNNTVVDDFKQTFSYCTSLTEIPEHLFDNCTAVTSFEQTFSLSTYISSIPEDLFKYNTEVTSFSYCFAGSSTASKNTLKSIPEGLFKYNTKAENMSYIFQNQTALESVPEDLFRYNTAVTDFSGVIQGCKGLTEVPEGLFKYNTEVTTFYGVLKNNTGLTTVPVGLFSNNSKVTSFEQSFYGCTGLADLPAGLFSNNKDVPNFGDIFRGCTSISSESPYDEITVDGETVKVHLYERKDYPDIYTTPTSYSRAFYDCTKMIDYDEAVAAGWTKA